MSIRETVLLDLEFLSNLFNEYRVFYGKSADILGAKKFLSERITNKDSKIYICENQERQLMGFVQLYPLFSSVRMKKIWLLNDLFVSPIFRGKGISNLLIERAKHLAQETQSCAILLETEKTNFVGNILYPKSGFVLNEVSNFYEWTNE